MLLGVVALGGCSDEGSVKTSDSSGTPAAPNDGWGERAGTRDGAPTITAPDGPAPQDLVTTDVTIGEGAELQSGQLAVVDYIGANYSNGVVFDASYGRAPFSVKIGEGKVIKGWDQGLVGMRVGGRRQLVIPPDLAYGDQSQGDIGPNETLIFLVDLRAALSRPKPQPAPDPVTELKITDVTEGSGDRAVESGDTVNVQYVGVLGGSGEEFDASWDRGEPFSFEVGAGRVIAGWDQGLIGMKLGGRRRLVIPGDLAYGATGSPPQIGPNEQLVFEIDLVGFG